MPNAAPNRSPVAIAIETDRPTLVAAAHELMAMARLPLSNPHDKSSAELILTMRDDGWELRSRSDKPAIAGRGFRIDFSHVLPRRGAGSSSNLSRKQPLARAMGRESKCIVDATAGLGHDASLLAAMGFEVVAIERNPVLAALLKDAVDRAARDDRMAKALGGRLRIVCGEARAVIPSLTSAPECIYLDPMFPPKRKASALARKEIRIVRELVGDDDDSADLLKIARNHSPRVVVKRPHHAQPLASDVASTIESNLVRYDIYKGS